MNTQLRRCITAFAAFMVLISAPASVARTDPAQSRDDLSPAANPVTVRIDRSAPVAVSRLELGVTHTQNDLDSAGAVPEAVAKVKKLLRAVCRRQVEPIMGWGADNPEPAPGVYNWTSLDRRIALIRSMHAVPVITLCAAPDWMKGGTSGKTDWSKIEVAPTPQHYADFAALAKTVAQRYPDVRYFQVWNEFKGFWDRAANNWNYRGYTQMYNLVYDALKSVNPAIQVGGPYLVLEGTGLNPHEWYGVPPISPRNWQVLDYWLAHKHGADFIVLDRSITDANHDPTPHSPAQVMPLTHYFEDIARQVHRKTSLPIWWAEYYGAEGIHDLDFEAAQFASVYAHMAQAGVPQIAFLWGFLQSEGGAYYLFSSVKSPDGGQTTPHYRVFQIFHDDFGPGTPLYAASSSSPDVEVLASASKLLLINKCNAPVRVRVAGRTIPLARYEVRLLSSNGHPPLSASKNRPAQIPVD
jgi:hypothetical protein